MRVIIIEDTVYKVTEKEYKKIQKLHTNNVDDLFISNYFEINKNKYHYVGCVDYDFRL